MTTRTATHIAILLFGLTPVLLLTVLTGRSPAQEQPALPGRIVITLEPGDHWESHLRLFWFLKKAKRPQMAFWLEDADGRFVATMYVTRRTALQDWRAMPFQDASSIERPSSLPVWTHRHVRGGIHSIETCSHCHDRIRSADKSATDDPILDAFTGATPETGFTREWGIPPELAPGDYVVWAELNHSFDYNDSYPEDSTPGDPSYNGVSGQPSLCWRGRLTIGDTPSLTVLELAGHGHPAGTDGRIYPLDGSITTAREIASRIELELELTQ